MSSAEVTTADGAASAPVTSTGSRFTRGLGLVVLAGLALQVFLSFVASPADVNQQDAVRIMYVHVPSVFAMYAGFVLAMVGSAMYLWKRTEFWDTLAGAAAEIGALFCGLVLVTGSIWGKPTWGSYWEWDARMTSTALLFVSYIGYLVIRRLRMDPQVRSKRAAVFGLFAFLNVPIVHYSVDWWNERSLHQDSTITRLDPQIDDEMLFTLMTSITVFALLFTWMLIHRFRLEFLISRAEVSGLATAIDARRAEAGLAAAEPRVEVAQ